MLQEKDERIDLVNINDQVVTTVWRSQFNQHMGLFMRIVVAIPVDINGNIGICKRAAHKKNYPNYFSCIGGVVKSGEYYSDAIVRETAEEVGIIKPTEYFEMIGHLQPDKITKAHRRAYRFIIKPDELHMNPDDFSEIKFLSHEEIAYTMKHELFSPSFMHIYEQYLIASDNTKL